MKEMPGWGKGLLFLSSFSPLYIVMALKAYGETYTLFGHLLPSISIFGISISFLAIASIALLIISVAFLAFVLYITRTREGQLETAEDCENRNDLVAEYLVVYIFPLAVLDYGSLADIGIFLALFVAIGAIQVRSNRLYVNPTLTAFGYHVYMAQIQAEERLIISKEKLGRSNVPIKTTELSNGVYVSTT